MNTRVNPVGFSDDADTATAAQLNALDIQQAQSVDGVGGGAYTPAAPLLIGGAGISVNPLLNTTQTGTATRSAAGHFPERVSKNLYVDANFNGAAQKLLDTTFDTYWFDNTVAMTQDWNLDLAVVTGQLAVNGDILRVVVKSANGFVVRVRNEGNATQIARLSAAYTFQQGNSPLQAEFFWDAAGGLWRPLRFTADVFG